MESTEMNGININEKIKISINGKEQKSEKSTSTERNPTSVD